MNNETPAAETDLADIDRHFASFIAGFGGDRDVVEPMAALLSRSIRAGHICLDLKDVAETSDALQSPTVEEVPAKLRGSRAVGGPDANTPIVLDNSQRLYLRRYWDYEQAVADAILRKARHNQAKIDTSGTQAAAIEAALQNRFTIISGGPGTGKTTTVLQILQHLLSKSGANKLRIALAAPTGKAAARLEELLRKARESSELDTSLKERMPKSASTIHRLLGWKADSVSFRHNARNPLPLDVIVVDEASMVSLALMAKVFDALTETSRLILVGDRDQLASVQPGAVLADIAEAASMKGSALRGALVNLTKNYRFGNENAIYQLASAVRAGDTDTALGILRGTELQELGSGPVPAAAQVGSALQDIVLREYQHCLQERDPGSALAAFQRFRVLTALREGPFGVIQLNTQIESVLRKHGHIPDSTQLYAGMPLLITENDYQAKLYNGDLGILLPDPAELDDRTGQLWAWFIGQDSELRRLSPARLPPHERAYAMTVHKAQGSEFERVLLVLPDRDSPILARELIYTGVTRASKRVDVWFNEEVLRAAIPRRAIRRSGLISTLNTL